MSVKLIKYIYKKIRYPYVYSHRNFFDDGQVIKFKIHNQIEDFRLRKFGSEKAYTKRMVASLQSNDVFFDIGASVGAVSIPVAIKLKKGKVYSFEPDPNNVSVLKKNFRLNSLENYRILELAVGDSTGDVSLYTKGSDGASPSIEAVNGIDNQITVPLATIDSLIQDGHLDFPTVVKIDIEGAEMKALQGMSELLSNEKKPRLIYMELHPKFLPAFGTDVSEILKYLLNKGYKVNKIENRESQLLCDFTYRR